MPSTIAYRRGDIVLVSFPFTDLTSSKRRPALVLSPDDVYDPQVLSTRVLDLNVREASFDRPPPSYPHRLEVLLSAPA